MLHGELARHSLVTCGSEGTHVRATQIAKSTTIPLICARCGRFKRVWDGLQSSTVPRCSITQPCVSVLLQVPDTCLNHRRQGFALPIMATAGSHAGCASAGDSTSTNSLQSSPIHGPARPFQ